MASPAAAGSILNLSRKLVRTSISNTGKRWKSSTTTQAQQQQQQQSTTNTLKNAVIEQHKTQWPTSFQGFIRGEPLITRRLPFLDSLRVDFGTAMMNIGAITSLTGFMMTDVLLLRTLSIFGSLCGVIYNLTRVPSQWNAVAWGLVFISVNGTRTIQLLMGDEIKFSVEEAKVYYRKFQPHGVEPKIFKKLMELAVWKTIEPGEDVVTSGKPLKNVHILIDGEASAYSGEGGERMYGYTSEENGCIIGATAIVDPSIIGRVYPNRIVADRRVRLLSFDTRKLREFFQSTENGPIVQVALLHLIYVDLIENLRRHRREQKEEDGSTTTQQDDNDIAGAMGRKLGELKDLLASACSDGIISSTERRQVRELVEKYDISDNQFKAVLKSDEIGWTFAEWKDGAKAHKTDGTSLSLKMTKEKQNKAQK